MIGGDMGQVAYETINRMQPGFITVVEELMRLGRTPNQIIDYMVDRYNPNHFLLAIFENAIRYMYKEMINERTT